MDGRVPIDFELNLEQSVTLSVILQLERDAEAEGD
jgi:hypothetical protein